MFYRYVFLILMLISTALYGQDTIVSSKSEAADHIGNGNIFKLDKQLFSGSISCGIENYSNNYLMREQTMSNFYWRSDISLNLFNIPIGFRYNYSTVSQLIGNKSFSLFFNKLSHDKLKDKLVNVTENNFKADLDSLGKMKQQIIKKSAYSEYKLKNYDKFKQIKKEFNTDTILPNIPKLADNDSLDPALNIDKEKEELVKDSLKLIQSIIEDREKISELDHLMNQKELEMKRLEYEDSEKKYRSKKDRMLDKIKVFEVGYAYPSYSRYLIRGNLLKGINMEFEDSNRYFAVSYGKIANNFPEAHVQNPLDQFTSFFDTDYTTEKRVLAAKTGIGKKHGSHFFIGGLLGRGSANNYFTSNPTTSNKNIVFETDANFQLGRNGNVNMIYAKSFLSRNNLPQLDHSEYISKKTNMLESTLNYRFDKIIDKIEVNSQYSEPLFKSFGINYINTDFLIYKAEAHKSLNNRLKCKLGYKKENYNLQENSIPIKIHSLVIGADYKISKKLRVSSTLQPSIGNDDQVNNNVISNIMVNYFDINKNSQTNITTSFNDFRIINDTSNYNLQNFVAGINYSFNKVTIGGTVLHLSSNEILRKKETIYKLDLSYQITDRLNSLIGAKYSINNSKQDSNGFVFKLNYRKLILDGLNIEALYEKRVHSEMYYLNLVNPQIFKYYSRVQIAYNF